MTYRPLLSFQYRELEFIRYLHLFRTPFLDYFFLLWSYADRSGFFIILFPIIWFGISELWGARLFYLVCAQMHVVNMLKSIFNLPRPCVIDPSVGILHLTSPGMPSGAAMSSIILPGMLIYAYPRWWTWLVGGLFWFFLSFSRVYLGVHFPSDVFVGWCVGALLLYLFIRYHQTLEDFLSRISWRHALVIAVGVPVLLYLIAEAHIAPLSFAMAGISLGLALNKRDKMWMTDPVSLTQRITRIGICLLGVAVIYVLLTFEISLFPYAWMKSFKKPLIQFIAGLWISRWVVYFIPKYAR